MEEKDKKELSYEQLQKVATMWQEKALEAQRQLMTINFTSVRLEFLFKVLDKATYFPGEFVEKCVAEIVDTLDIKEENNG